MGYSRFLEGTELAECDEKCGRPKSIGTEVDIVAIADLVISDCRFASRMIAEFLYILKSVVLRILKEVLRKGMLCACFVHTP
jgi:hypothetical protein